MFSSPKSRKSRLSKSRIALFEQCPRRLWLAVHRPELTDDSKAVKASFAHGHEIGDLACRLLPGGHMVSASRGLGAALDETANLIATGFDRPIFEATFEHDGVLIRADLLIPDGDAWHLAEVKNTAGVKAYHLSDIATQVHVVRGSGLSVSRASIRHVSRDFVLTAEGQYDGLFADSDVDEQIEPLVAERNHIISQARDTLEGDEPAIDPGDHCTNPFPCSFSKWCSRHMPPAPEWSTEILPGQKGKKLAQQWRERGISDIFEMPPASLTSPILQRIYRATVDDIAYHDPDGARQEIAE